MLAGLLIGGLILFAVIAFIRFLGLALMLGGIYFGLSSPARPTDRVVGVHHFKVAGQNMAIWAQDHPHVNGVRLGIGAVAIVIGSAMLLHKKA